MDGNSLSHLPAGAAAHPSLKPVPDGNNMAILFSEGGITLPTAGHLTAAAGTIDLRCRMPEAWPAKGDRSLFHAGQKGHVHVTLLFRDGVLMAVYKGGEPYFAAVRFPRAAQWEPLTWHRVQFAWQADGNDVDFLLRVDDRLVGAGTGRLIEDWPATCSVGVRGTTSPWQGLMTDIVLSPTALRPPELAPGRRTIAVLADKPVGDCYAFWTTGNFNKPQLFADANYPRSIRRDRPFVKEVNAVYLLGGRYVDQNRWFLGLGPDGKLRADFAGMIVQLKVMQEAGYTPRIVLDNVPYEMSDPPQENTYGNTAPPADEKVWHGYVEAAVRAMVEAFGRQTVAGWSFRVGTEPDLRPGHWAGTKEQYLAHYDYTVDAVTRVIGEADIGPGNILNPVETAFGDRTRDQWGLDIIDHAAAGRNYCTGKTGTRMTWFSCSWYGRVGGPISEFDEAIRRIRERLGRYPRFAGVRVEVGEFAVLHDESGRRLWGGDTTEWAASFYAALADRVYTHGVRSVYEWAQTTAGVPHPRAHVLWMLERMSGGKRLTVQVDADSAARCGAVAAAKDGRLYVLLYNHRALRRPKVAEAVNLVVRDGRMKPGQTWRRSEWVIDAEHTVWAYAFLSDCLAAGVRPLPETGRYEGSPSHYFGQDGPRLFHRHRDKYAKLAVLPKTTDNVPVAVGPGQLELQYDMPGHSVRLIELTPER